MVRLSRCCGSERGGKLGSNFAPQGSKRPCVLAVGARSRLRRIARTRAEVRCVGCHKKGLGVEVDREVDEGGLVSGSVVDGSSLLGRVMAKREIYEGM